MLDVRVGGPCFERLMAAVMVVPPPFPKLTDHQKRMLEMCAGGMGAAETADVLGVKTGTVIQMLGQAKEKLGCLNVTHTVATAIRLGLIMPPPP